MGGVLGETLRRNSESQDTPTKDRLFQSRNK